MKVLVISSTFPPLRSGGADYAFWLCKALAENGQDVHVVTSRIENVATEPSMHIYPIMSGWSWRHLPRLWRFARRCQPDVVNVHFQRTVYDEHPMVTFVPALLKRTLPFLRVVTHIEEPSPPRTQLQPRPVRVVRKFIARWWVKTPVDYAFGTLLDASDRLVVLSAAHRLALNQHLPGVEKKCVLIPPPPNLRLCPEDGAAAWQKGRRQLGLAAETFLINYFGYLYPGKGLETLLQAFARVALRRDNVRLVVVGGSNQFAEKVLDRPNYAQDLHQLASQLGVADRVTWTGYCAPDCDLASLYFKCADACVLPFENGISLNNSSFAAAVAHALPIVTTKGETVEPAFVDGKNVLFTPPRDAEALAAAIEQLMDNPDLAQRLRRGAVELAEEWFSWNKVVRRTLAAFRGEDDGEGPGR
jgi:glycosyltransferase involved in cell wall biosynthesis